MTAATDWNPQQYDRFKRERSQPLYDLVALLQPSVRSLVDLGCGTGELTAHLVGATGASVALGLDSSAAMLAEAATHTIDGVLTFAEADIASWTDAARFDLVLANASLQWVANHHEVLARWCAALAPRGQLAVQVPYNHDHPAHTVADELRRRQPYSTYAIPHDPVGHNVLSPEQYSVWLYEAGFTDQIVRLQVYGHELPDVHAVVEWVKGTTLTRFAKALPAEMYEQFLSDYRSELVRALGDARPYFYPFKRILFWGRKA
jgi:trans-aconitate 2-methyltransferase